MVPITPSVRFSRESRHDLALLAGTLLETVYLREGHVGMISSKSVCLPQRNFWKLGKDQVCLGNDRTVCKQGWTGNVV